MSGLDEFDHIALFAKYATDDGGFEALFNKSLVKLGRTHPEGFSPRAPGREAWDSLNEAQKDRALDSLLFTYFCDHRREADESLHHDEITSGSSYLRPGDLDQLAHAAVSARGEVPVDSASLWRAVKELRLLSHRISLLHMLRTTEPMTEEAVQALYAQLKADLDGNDEGGQ
ncbi:hypothetical protein [Streptomyces sp. NPDC008139]|uniref:hypothetical protein n=1 Tax=Streptomyces sp. NPDC008139 TaxID=3364814 RepID=UPI0036E355C1